MKIRSITLDNIRRFTDPVRMGEIGDGLNVLCGPNEQGKSTLFDAIRALFFKPHGSRDKQVTGFFAVCVGVQVSGRVTTTRDVVSQGDAGRCLSRPATRCAMLMKFRVVR